MPAPKAANPWLVLLLHGVGNLSSGVQPLTEVAGAFTCKASRWASAPNPPTLQGQITCLVLRKPSRPWTLPPPRGVVRGMSSCSGSSHFLPRCLCRELGFCQRNKGTDEAKLGTRVLTRESGMFLRCSIHRPQDHRAAAAHVPGSALGPGPRGR